MGKVKLNLLSLRSKRLRAVWEQRMRNEKTARKMALVKERGGGGEEK